MTAPQELRTSRLLLRSVQRTDIQDLVRLAGEREIAGTTINIPHPYHEYDARNFFVHSEAEFREGRSHTFAIADLTKSIFCGVIGMTLVPEHLRAELGYWVGRPYWGLGIATEAASAVLDFGFGTLHLHRIHASHFVGNISSQRVLEKIGMRREGSFREHVRKWDRFIDLENYGLLAREYNEIKQKT